MTLVGASSGDNRRRRIVLACVLAISCFLGTRGITDESSVMLGGDMARYVMDGVFVRDLIADGRVFNYGELQRHAERYYAKYPALSLGHHPPLTYLSVVPFYWIFGVTLLAARMAALTWFLAATLGLYAVARRLFNWQVASWAAMLFATNVVVLRAGQYLLSEMPMTALVLWAVHALLVFCEKPQPFKLLRFVGLAVASLYAKQLAVLMFPVYFALLVWRLGWRSLATSRAVLGIGVVLVLSVPLAMMTVGLAPVSFGMAALNAARTLSGQNDVAVNRVIQQIFSQHMLVPTMAMTAASVVLLLYRRRPVALIGLLWVVSVVVGSVVLTGATEPARYAFGALPAYYLLIAGLAAEARGRAGQVIAGVLLFATLCCQAWTVWNVYPSGATGYETAAESVLERVREPAILYDSSYDTGYFVFFMRKHDPLGRQIILRADKLIGEGSAKPDQDRRDFYTALHRFGVRWVVTEERRTGPQMLRIFHEEFQGSHFAERQRIPVVSTAAPGLDLIIYEYLDARPADLDTELRFELPLGRRKFSFRLGELISQPR